MGKRGPIAKDPAKAQGHRTRALIALPKADDGREIPRPPVKILASTRRSWIEFWQSPLAATVEAVDLPVVLRLFRLRDQWERAMRVLRETMMVKGSMGQARVNPLADYVARLEGSMLKLETELGLTPMARARLGIEITEAVESLDRMNARFKDEETDDPDDARAPEADPRLASLHLTDQNG